MAIIETHRLRPRKPPTPHRRLLLHVGMPRGGGARLRSTLDRHADWMRDLGVLYPQTPDDVMFRAALDVCGTHRAWGRAREEVADSWDGLCRQAWAHAGTTAFGHELLAAAGRRQVDSALSMLRGLDVHVVLTVADTAAADLADVAHRWGRHLAPGRVHVLETSSSVVDDDRLWQRWAALAAPRAVAGPAGQPGARASDGR